MSDVVYANQSCVLAHNGQRIHVRAGEPWAANDPLVARYPDHFVNQLPAVRVTTDPRGFRDVTAPPPAPAPAPAATPPANVEKPVTDQPPADESAEHDARDGDDEVPEQATAAPGERRATGRRRGGAK